MSLRSSLGTVTLRPLGIDRGLPTVVLLRLMIDRNKTRRILWYEGFGFLMLIALSWLNELVSLPQLLFGSAQSSNWHEALMETTAIAAVWTAVALYTRRLTRRLFYLDGFLRVCGWCRKIGHDGEWTTVENYFTKGFDIKTSHGMCPECHEKWNAQRAQDAA